MTVDKMTLDKVTVDKKTDEKMSSNGQNIKCLSAKLF